MAEHTNSVDDLRLGFGNVEKQAFSAALGGYHRGEVNANIQEQSAAVQSMKRVFYEKTQELRDELQLVSQENRRLRASLGQRENFVEAPLPLCQETADRREEHRLEDDRAMVEKVAGILKSRHAAQLARKEGELAALRTRLAALDAGRAGVEETLSQREAELARAASAIGQKEMELARAKEETSRIQKSLAEKERELARANAAFDQKQAELQRALAGLEEKERARQGLAAELLAREEDITRLASIIAQRQNDSQVGAAETRRCNVIAPKFGEG